MAVAETEQEPVEIVRKLTGLLNERRTRLIALSFLEREIDDLKKKLATWMADDDPGIVVEEPPESNGQQQQDEGVAEKAHQSLLKHPGEGWGPIALEVYGDDTPETRVKARNIVYYLRKLKMARPIEGKRGKWEAIVPSG
jgi:hypothetical protein